MMSMANVPVMMASAKYSRASVLIYVLWILVVISALAFQLATSSKVMSLDQSAAGRQLKDDMQLQSAIQFARFKIASNQWDNGEYELNLNNQDLKIHIFNESGYISLYNLRSESLKNVFKSLNISHENVTKLENKLDNNGKVTKLNDYLELLQNSIVDRRTLDRLVSLVSILSDGEVNPFYAPVEVLMKIPGVDQYRVRKMAETSDREEAMHLRNEIAEQLSSRSAESQGDLSPYYRVLVTFSKKSYWAFLKYDRRDKNYKTVLTFNAHAENQQEIL